MSTDSEFDYGWRGEPSQAPVQPPLVHRVYFDHNGAITGHAVMPDPPARPGQDHVDLADPPHGLHHKRHKIDLVTRLPVEMSDAEKREANAPTHHEVAHAIYLELSATDQFAHPPPDRPMQSHDKDAWLAYRKTLRDLSKVHKGDHHAQLRAWPLRPDGGDPVAHLKARL